MLVAGAIDGWSRRERVTDMVVEREGILDDHCLIIRRSQLTGCGIEGRGWSVKSLHGVRHEVPVPSGRAHHFAFWEAIGAG